MVYNSNMVGLDSQSLNKEMLRSFPHNAPIATSDLAAQGISGGLAAHYAKSGWLDRLGRGVYAIPGGSLDRDECLLFLQQRISGLHVGGRTALDWRGSRQYLETNPVLTLWSGRRTQLPVWFTTRFPSRLTSSALFTAEVEAAGISTPAGFLDGLRVSNRERALLEMLREVETQAQIDEAREILEVSVGLRMEELGHLMSGCRSVKTVRLMLTLLDTTGMADVAKLRREFTLPTGSHTRWIGTLSDGTRLVLQP